MSRDARTLFVTGATGLLTGETLARMLRDDMSLRAVSLVRDRKRWARAARRLALPHDRVEPIVGDLLLPGLGLRTDERRRIAHTVTDVLHGAADTTFSLSLSQARSVNTDGTERVLDLFHDLRSPRRFVFVSTAFVAGRLTGRIDERADAGRAGWVNGYEQSKYEAEAMVRFHAPEWTVFRPGSVVCESMAGTVRQVNAVHRALRLYWQGLASMMPGADGTLFDAVTTGYVARAIAALAFRDDLAGRAVHLCAGSGAMRLETLLDVTHEHWSRDDAWRGLGIPRPTIADLETYRRFERAVCDAGDERLAKLIRALGHFTPQLAYPKVFDTSIADAALDATAPEVARFWPRMIDCLLAQGWAGVDAAAQEAA